MLSQYNLICCNLNKVIEVLWQRIDQCVMLSANIVLIIYLSCRMTFRNVVVLWSDISMCIWFQFSDIVKVIEILHFVVKTIVRQHCTAHSQWKTWRENIYLMKISASQKWYAISMKNLWKQNIFNEKCEKNEQFEHFTMFWSLSL